MVRSISVALAAVVILLCSIFLLRALTLEAELVKRTKLHDDGEYEIARVPMKPKDPSVSNALSVEMRLMDVAKAAPSGQKALERLPRGELGGRVIGRGRDIQGVFRLVRIHHDLADWWADQSSLVALTEWLNTQTKIRTDM